MEDNKILIIDEKYPGLVDEGFRYKIEGKIETKLNIEIKLGKWLYVIGDISSGGDIRSVGDIYFSYHLSFSIKIKCQYLRISWNDSTERSFWIEKMNLFGFKKVAEALQSGCVEDVRRKVLAIKGASKKLLACKYWTKTERLVLMSWIDGKLEYEEPKKG